MQNRETFRLYAPARFLEGVARLFDFGGWLDQYNYSHSNREADRRAIKSDWQFVGEDLQHALADFIETHPLEK